jgi:hypothetical protein
MICPKCDFSQPDDYYCAQCGVNVEKYVQKKKKRFNLGLIITVLSILQSPETPWESARRNPWSCKIWKSAFPQARNYRKTLTR